MKKFSISLLLIFVMIICCVSAVSATDIDDNIVPDDVDIIALDDAADSVDDVEKDTGNPTRTSTVTDATYGNFFNTNTGYLTTTDDLIFSGNFTPKSFGNFKINEGISIDASQATFNNVGFDLLANGITLSGATMNFDAPANANCYAIYVSNSANTQILNNNITYSCEQNNANYYNYVIKVKDSSNVTVSENNINATLPLKTVQHYNPNLQGIDKDFVAGVGVSNSNMFKFLRNNLTVTGDRRVGDFPTLDAFIIVNSNYSQVKYNKIIEADIVSNANQYSYIYGVDVYSCYGITIDNNTIIMNGNESCTQIGGNATGAAYCIQLSGNHTGVTISNNNLTTQNLGPNLGIYSQNYQGSSALMIYNNVIDVTGYAGTEPWSVLSGMELQDSIAYVENNVINVHNLAGYIKNCQAYGISYCQYTAGNHIFQIYDNEVTVDYADFAIYIMNADLHSEIDHNVVHAGNKSGNDAIYVVGITPGDNSGNWFSGL